MVTADMLNVDLPERILLKQSERIRMAGDKYGVEITSTMDVKTTIKITLPLINKSNPGAELCLKQ